MPEKKSPKVPKRDKSAVQRMKHGTSGAKNIQQRINAQIKSSHARVKEVNQGLTKLVNTLRAAERSAEQAGAPRGGKHFVEHSDPLTPKQRAERAQRNRKGK